MASSSKAEQLAEALNELLATSPNAEAAAVVSYDGLTMASALPAEIDEERLGAMSAALLGLGEQASLGLGRGELNQLFVEGEHGLLFLMSAQDQAVLAVVTDSQTKIGFALFEMRRTARAIGEILGSDDDEVTDWDVADGAFAHPGDVVPAVEVAQAPIDTGHDLPLAAPDVDPVVEATRHHDAAAGGETAAGPDAAAEDEAAAQVPHVVESPYRPGPIPADLASNPYYLAPRAWSTGDAQDESN